MTGRPVRQLPNHHSYRCAIASRRWTTTTERTNNNMYQALSGLALPALWWGYLIIFQPRK